MSRHEKGSVTIWMLGLSFALLAFGGLALDFWRGLALQRELAAIADSAAIASASGIDEEQYRSTGDVILAPARARSLAHASIDHQSLQLSEADVTVNAARSSVTVEVGAELELWLLSILVDDDQPISVRASASASPVLIP